MWGEVMELLQEENRTYLDQNDIEYNNQRNKAYMIKSDEQMILEEYLPLNQPIEEWRHITATGVCDYMFEKHGKSLKPRAVGKAFASMGIEQERCRVAGKLGRYYVLPFLQGYSMPF